MPENTSKNFGEILTQEILYNEYVRLSNTLDKAIDSLFTLTKEAAEKDNIHRRAKAQAFLKVLGAKNQAEREAKADADFADQRYDAVLAEGLKEATIEQVRGLRNQLSALQTFVAARRSELEATSYGQTK
jgi:hypothetical protein